MRKVNSSFKNKQAITELLSNRFYWPRRQRQTSGNSAYLIKHQNIEGEFNCTPSCLLICRNAQRLYRGRIQYNRLDFLEGWFRCQKGSSKISKGTIFRDFFPVYRSSHWSDPIPFDSPQEAGGMGFVLAGTSSLTTVRAGHPNT